MQSTKANTRYCSINNKFSNEKIWDINFKKNLKSI